MFTSVIYWFRGEKSISFPEKTETEELFPFRDMYDQILNIVTKFSIAAVRTCTEQQATPSAGIT